MRFSAESPQAKRSVQNSACGESIGRSGRSVQENCGVLPCISDADRFTVFRGVHACLHRSVHSVKDNKIETLIFVLESEGRVLAIICELHKSTFLFRNIQHTECGIAGGLNPVSVNSPHARFAAPLADPHIFSLSKNFKFHHHELLTRL